MLEEKDMEEGNEQEGNRKEKEDGEEWKNLSEFNLSRRLFC